MVLWIIYIYWRQLSKIQTGQWNEMKTLFVFEEIYL
jgi:hypothetical protein